MIHFFERMEREIDFSEEYKKLEEMVCNEYYYNSTHIHFSINDWIEENFRKWNKRQNYTSFFEVREQMGFPIIANVDDSYHFPVIAGMEEYFLYFEMLVNILLGLKDIEMPSKMEEGTVDIINTGNATIEKVGFEIKEIRSEYIIVEKNAVAVEVADIVPELADVVIEYNHFILRGNITRKQELLKKIADAIEPKKKTLKAINKNATDDFLWMVNKMNIRHNNCDAADTKNYNPWFAKLHTSEQEAWYDRIYDQALMLFVLLESQERNTEIHNFKRIVEG